MRRSRARGCSLSSVEACSLCGHSRRAGDPMTARTPRLRNGRTVRRSSLPQPRERATSSSARAASASHCPMRTRRCRNGEPTWFAGAARSSRWWIDTITAHRICRCGCPRPESGSRRWVASIPLATSGRRTSVPRLGRRRCRRRPEWPRRRGARRGTVPARRDAAPDRATRREPSVSVRHDPRLAGCWRRCSRSVHRPLTPS